IADLVSSMSLTPWPAVPLLAELLLAAAAIFTLVTALRWQGSAGRKYRSATDAPADPARPHDAIDSWDDLSRGADPTA
ncbi:Trp biosynthesis-associated membrane protein, partial [Enterococcus faecium]|uniref:Trp biosynthesis-associated membrane protein n=1 Tax=Enterococcus faecium TaxID=1352 RepID=UPI003AB0874B